VAVYRDFEVIYSTH